MTDLPSGEWSFLLVGHQWPERASLSALAHSAKSRADNSSGLNEYARSLSIIRTITLANQRGATAENLADAFRKAELATKAVSAANETKQAAYAAALLRVQELREVLKEIAKQGNSEINSIRSSNQSPSKKISEIVATVVAAQSHANAKAAECCASLLEAIQSVNATGNIQMSARQLASASGVDLGSTLRSPNVERTSEIVEQMLEETKLGAARNGPLGYARPDDDGNLFSAGESSAPIRANKAASTVGAANLAKPIQEEVFNHVDAEAGSVVPPVHQEQSLEMLQSEDSFGFSEGQAQIPLQSDSSTPIGSLLQSGPSGAAATNPQIAASASISNHSTSSQLHATNAASEIGVANSANSSQLTPVTPHGSSVDPGASTYIDDWTKKSVSTGSEAIAPTTADIHRGEVTTPLRLGMAGSTPSPLTDSPSAFLQHQDIAASPTREVLPPPIPPAIASPLVGGAIPSPPNTFAPTPPTAPQGPLLAYGSDLKPPVPTPQTAPPAAPISAPMTPAGNTSANNQPTVVRQHTTTPTTQGGGLTERAFAATAAGAVAGATVKRAEVVNRLRRLLHAVARQQPQLRWAIGDRDDGTTVLVTDLAHGWVPPGIGVPVGVQLLPPGTRRYDLDALLGAAAVRATYEPGQYLEPGAEPTLMSIRARDTARIDELGWELSQSTKWRDGLPRLAHTLARAASAGTGILDSEAALLREHLKSVERAVLSQYPDVDPVQVADWQLLATIEALIADETTSANYHFAWFRAQTLTGEARR